MKKFNIPASPQNTNAKRRFRGEISVVLGDDIENSYSVSAKDFPDDLPSTWTPPGESAAKEITWLGNFGLSASDGTPAERVLPGGAKYAVHLAKAKVHVYYDGSEVRKLSTRPVPGQPDLVQADLDLGDPPIGTIS